MAPVEMERTVRDAARATMLVSLLDRGLGARQMAETAAVLVVGDEALRADRFVWAGEEWMMASRSFLCGKGPACRCAHLPSAPDFVALGWGAYDVARHTVAAALQRQADRGDLACAVSCLRHLDVATVQGVVAAIFGLALARGTR